MSDPVIVPRAEHPISRRDIDPDALKVLYRLQQFNYTAYLVGGGVRDLLLGRRPKDFDVGTSAHPYQIKKLFRNCWIIGRRFRLAHVRFGQKTIEVATFRRNMTADEGLPLTPDPHIDTPLEPPEAAGADDLQIRHDNTFGTAEEDAFRRDFTINALFYDIATFAIIDYVGGLQDLTHRLIRSIGDPEQRFQEDPVRMLRAVSFAARLEFDLDAPVAAAIARHKPLLATAAPARLIEEYYKILRSGSAERTFRLLAEHGLLGVMTPELQHAPGRDAMWRALADLDAYRRRFETMPAGLTNAVLIGSLLVPLGLMPRRDHESEEPEDGSPWLGWTAPGVGAGSRQNNDELIASRRRRYRPPKPPVLKVGMLPIARRDSERLRQVLALQRRLLDLHSSARAKRALMHRGPFDEALTWLDVHGRAPEVVEHWRGFLEAVQADGQTRPTLDSAPGDGPDGPHPRRRRRRRGGRRFRGRGPKP